MWDAIEEVEQDADMLTFSGDLFVLLFDSDCELNLKVRDRVERIAVRLPGNRDLRFVFLPSATHVEQHNFFNFEDLPSALLLRDGVEHERCSSIDDVLELAAELFEIFK